MSVSLRLAVKIPLHQEKQEAMKNQILILLLTFYSLISYSNGAGSGKSNNNFSGTSTTFCEAPTEDDSLNLKRAIPVCTTGLTKSKANPLSFYNIKSPSFKENCEEPCKMKTLTKTQKIFHKVLGILLVSFTIALVGIFASVASVSLLLFVIPL